MAWFIGWNMVLEYGVSASAVAVGWSGYFVSLLQYFGIAFPPPSPTRRSRRRLSRPPSDGRDRQSARGRADRVR